MTDPQARYSQMLAEKMGTDAAPLTAAPLPAKETARLGAALEASRAEGTSVAAERELARADARQLRDVIAAAERGGANPSISPGTFSELPFRRSPPRRGRLGRPPPPPPAASRSSRLRRPRLPGICPR